MSEPKEEGLAATIAANTRLLEKVLSGLDKTRDEDLLRSILDAAAPIIEAQKAKAASQLAVAQAEELKAMLELRKTMRESGEEETADIDCRIKYLMSRLKQE